MSGELVLSLFPGIGLLDMAFEEEGFCVVRGPDLLWGGDIKRFHPPAGKFDGVIGGPPCKGDSNLAHLNSHPGTHLRSEFRRVLIEVKPSWWVMEAVSDFSSEWWPRNTKVSVLNNRWLGEKQNRLRYFYSNLDISVYLEQVALENVDFCHAVLAGHGGARGRTYRGMTKYDWRTAANLQGLPPDWDVPPFTIRAKEEAIGNGVPLPMGRAVAKAVRKALGA